MLPKRPLDNDHIYRMFKNIALRDNFEETIRTGTTPGVANTEFNISHNLGRIPDGFLLLLQDQAAIFYKGVTAWTTLLVYLKCNVATVNYTIIIV